MNEKFISVANAVFALVKDDLIHRGNKESNS